MGYTVTGAGNANDKLTCFPTFVAGAADDFHLASTDTAALGAGTNLSLVALDANLFFSSDIDDDPYSRQTGTTTIANCLWDIGADEFVETATATPLYYHRRIS